TLPALAVTGTLDLIYPLTFGTQPPDNRHAKLLAVAKRAAAAGRWRAALATAERGLADVTFDGTVRRQLIEIAGIAACTLKRRIKARHYVELSPATAEQAVREACKRAGTAL